MENGIGRDGDKSCAERGSGGSTGMLVDGLGRSAGNRITDRSWAGPFLVSYPSSFVFSFSFFFFHAATLKILIIKCRCLASPYDYLGDWKGGGLPRPALAP